MHRPILVAAFLASILVVFFRDALPENRVLAPSDLVFNTPYYAPQRPPEFTRPANPLLFDQVYQFIPWRYRDWSELRAGSLRLWNPDSYCGSPSLGSMQSAALYPVHWLLLPLPFERTLLWSAFLRLLVAGFGTYLLARQFRLATAPSLAAAISFMLCGFLVVWLGHPHTNVAVWLPLLVLCAERTVVADDVRSRLGPVAGLALVVGIQFTGGHISTSTDLLVALLAFCVLRGFVVVRDARSGERAGRFAVRALVWPGIGVGLGTLLAAPQLLPFVEWLALSQEVHNRVDWRSGFSLWDPAFLHHLGTLPVLLVPDLYNNPTWGVEWTPRVSGNYLERVLYVGVVPLVLALGALARGRRSRGDDPAGRSFVLVWAATGLIALGRALSLPVLDWLSYLPGLSHVDPTRNRLIVAFSLCMLAGAGMEQLRRDLEVGARRGGRRFIVISVSLLAVGWIATQLVPLDVWKLQVPSLILLVASVLFAVVLRGPRVPVPVVQGLLIALIVTDLIAFGSGFNPTTPRESFYPRSPSAPARAAASIDRVTAIGWSSIPDTHLFEGFSDVRGMDYPTHWYAEYMDLTGDRLQTELTYGLLLSGVDSPLTRVLNLRYVLDSPPPSMVGQSGLTWRRAGPLLAVGQLESVQPRSFLVYEAEFATDDEQARELLRSEPERVYDRVVLSDSVAPSPAAGGDRPIERSRTAPADAVLLTDYRTHASAWKVEASQPGYVVTTDAYYPGWEAFVDGEQVPLLRANLAFRAVRVPAGTHRVEYRFEPASLDVGIVLGSLALVVTAMLAATGVVLGRRASATL